MTQSIRSTFNSLTISILSLLLSPLLLLGTFDDRRDWLIDQVRDLDPYSGTAKTNMPVACAQLFDSGGTDTEALEYVATRMGSEFYFRVLGQIRAYHLGKENFTEEQITALKNVVRAESDWNNRGTENHRLMTWTSGYLFAEAFPDLTWRWTENRQTTIISGEELKANLLELIKIRGQWRFSGGNSEHMSPNYDVFSIAAFLNLYDFAEDQEVRDLADAALHYYVGLIALGTDEGYILAPYSRNAIQGSRTDLAISQWIPWLYWGYNRPIDLPAGNRYIIYLALSSWRPDPILDSIGSKEASIFPFTARMQQPHWQRNPLRYVMKTTYRSEHYSMGSGVIRHIPGAFQLDDSHFSIAWKSLDEKRFIEAFHPYWRSASRGENYWNGPTSPFQQSVQHENTAILLYDIPEKDPWPGAGQWSGERLEDNIALAQVRIPKAVFQRVTDGPDWFFFNEGSTYIGIRSLKPGATFERGLDDERSLLFMFDVIQSREYQTGFIFEVGDEAEFGTFEAFQAQLLSNSLTIDWETLTVEYTNSRGDTLKIEYNTDLSIPDGSVPTSWINNQKIDHVNWPFIESPWVNLTGRVLTIHDGNTYTIFDWTDEFPVVSRGTGMVAPRLIAPFIQEGIIDTPFSASLDVLNSPDSFAANGLPDGLTIDSTTGTISGSPTTSGYFEAEVTATNSEGASTETLAFAIDGPPVVTFLSESQTLSTADAFVLETEAQSLTEVTWQWERDNVSLEIDVSSISFEAPTTDDSGIYSVIATNEFGTAEAVSVEITFMDPPNITEFPNVLSLTEGDAGLVSFNYTGSDPITFKWFKDDVLIEDETTESLAWESVQLSDAGSYKVEIENAVGVSTSDELMLTVEAIPTNLLAQVFPEASAFAENWYSDPTIGWIRELENGYAYHLQHLYWWVTGDMSGEGIYIYDFSMGVWLFTNTDYYPYFYRFSDPNPGIIIFMEGFWSESAGGRWFYDFDPAVSDYFFVPNP